MAFNAGDIVASLSMNMSNFMTGMRMAADQVRGLQTQFNNSLNNITNGFNNMNNATDESASHFKSLERVVGGIMISQAFYGAIQDIKSATSAVDQFSQSMEQAQISYTYLLGNSDKANAFLLQMQNFAATTSFNTDQAVSLSKRLMGAGFDPSEIQSVMSILNDASVVGGGSQAELSRIVLALTQMRTTGVLHAQDMNQLAQANIPVYQILQQQLGLTGKQMQSIGKDGIDSQTGITAILKGLQQRYHGAATVMANTMRGMLETIKDDSLMIASDMFSGIFKTLEGGIVTNIRDVLEKMRLEFSKYGLGGVINSMFPPELQQAIRLFIGGIQSIAQSVGVMLRAFEPAIKTFLSASTIILGYVIPAIAIFIRDLAAITQAFMQGAPWVKYFIATLMGLMIAGAAAKALEFLWAVTKMGTICAAVSKYVDMLVGAIEALFLVAAENPIIAVIMILAGALIYLAVQSGYAAQMIHTLGVELGKLAGFDMGKILQPQDNGANKYLNDYNKSVQGINKSLKDTGTHLQKVGKSAKKAGKKVKNSFVASFDELHQIPATLDATAASLGKVGGAAGAGTGTGLANLPKINLPKIETPKIPKYKPPKVHLPHFPFIPPMRAKKKPKDEEPKPPTAGKKKGKKLTAQDLLGMDPSKVTAAIAVTGEILKKGWENIRDKVKGALNGISDPFPVLVGYASNAVSNIEQFFGNIPSDVLSALSGLGNVFQGLFRDATPMMSNAVHMFVTDMLSVFSHLPTGVVSILEVMWAKVASVFHMSGGKMALIAGGIVLAIVGAIALLPEEAVAAIGAAVVAMASAFAELLPEVGSTLSKLPEVFSRVFGKIPDAGPYESRIASAFRNLPGNIMNFIKGIPNDVQGLFDRLPNVSSSVSRVGNYFSGLPGRIVSYIRGIPGEVGKYAGSWLPDVWGSVARVGDYFRGLPGRIVGYIRGIPGDFSRYINELPGRASDIVSQIVRQFRSLPGALASAIRDISRDISDVLGRIKVPHFSTFGSTVRAGFHWLHDLLPGYATGGIIDKEQIARVGEGGRREAIIPLANTGAMAPFARAVAVELAGMGGSGGNNAGGQPIMYVGTLIADDRSLRELERRMRVVRQGEGKRGAL